jgi:hypothetical protein
LKLGNACYHSVQNLLSSTLLGGEAWGKAAIGETKT